MKGTHVKFYFQSRYYESNFEIRPGFIYRDRKYRKYFLSHTSSFYVATNHLKHEVIDWNVNKLKVEI
jgi:hypothetical protein